MAFPRSFATSSVLVVVVTSYLAVLTVEEILESRLERRVGILLTEFFAEGGHGAELVRWSVDDSNRKRPAVALHAASYVRVEREDIQRLADMMGEALGRPIKLTVTHIPAATVTSEGYFVSTKPAEETTDQGQ